MIFPLIFSMLLSSIILSMLFGISYTLMHLASVFWLSLVSYSTYYIIFSLLSESFNKNVKRILVLFNIFAQWTGISQNRIIIIFVAISFLAGFSKFYYLGGDDTRLFYIYPELYLNNLASSTSPGNSLSAMVSFLPNRSVYYFAMFLTTLKTLIPFLNLQSTLYAANILFGIYFFYKLLYYLIPDTNKYSKWIYLLSSFFYVFSLFNIYILYNARLIAIFLITIFPLSIYLLLRAVRESKIHFIVFTSIIWSVFAVVSAASLWFLASVIVITPLIIYLLKEFKLRTFAYLCLLGLLLFFMNLHWLYLIPYTTLVNKSGISENNVNSEDFLRESSRGLISNAEINEVFFPLNNLFHFQIQDNFKWPYLPIFEQWYLVLIPFTSIFIVTIVFAGMARLNDALGKLHKMSLITLLLALYFFTINLGKTSLGNWGIELFVFLTGKIPGFVAFRNMYDKFGFVLSFTYSVTLAISLMIIFRKVNDLYKKRILVAISIITLLIALPYLTGRFRKLPIWKTSGSYHTTTRLNSDYLAMMEFISRTNDVGRYLTLPLSRGNIAFIQDDEQPNHFYVGVSPNLIFSGINDYSGGISFGIFEKEFNESLVAGNYEVIADILRRTNTKYVIVNHTITPDLKNSYLLGDGLYDLQGEKFQNVILGDLVRDFGLRYSLYKINPKLENSKIFSINSDELESNIRFKKVSDVEYDVQPSLDANERLVFLDPFMNGWDLYQSDGKTKIETTNEKYDTWANSWTFPGGNVNDLKVIFTPSRHLRFYSFVSNTTLTISIFYVLYSLKKKNDQSV